MKQFMLLTTAAAFALVAGAASAVTVTNTDKAETKLLVDVGGKMENLTLKENGIFDSKGKDAIITLGKEKPVIGKADEKFVIKGGKLEVASATTVETKTEVKTEEVKTEAVKPVEKTVTTETKTTTETK